MLGTLMKYEFKSMWQRLSVFYLAWLGTGVLMGLLLRGTEFGALGVVTVFAFVALTMIAVILTMVEIIENRFNKNLLGDEGYFTMTLPVSLDSILMGKTFSSVIWLIVSYFVAVIAGICFMVIGSGNFSIDWSFMHEATAAQKAKAVAIFLESLAIMIVFLARFVLKIYASISVGNQFTKCRGLMSVVAYIIFGVMEVCIIDIITKITSVSDLGQFGFFISADEVDGVSNYTVNNDVGLFLGIIVVGLAIAAIYYFITRYLLKNRLNLQ